jgi:hypothetical protein
MRAIGEEELAAAERFIWCNARRRGWLTVERLRTVAAYGRLGVGR